MKNKKYPFDLKFVLTLCFFFSLCFLNLIKAQETSSDLLPSPDLNLLPISPEAAGLGRYGDNPVSEFTGTPDISVPIYTLDYKDLSLPISLRYQSNAVKVNQEATWCGLGWDLVAGGCINYVIVGGNDQNSMELPKAEREKAIEFVADTHPFQGVTYEDNYDISCLSHERDPDIRLFITAATIFGAGEQDYYSVNFLNHSFKFIIHPITGLPTFYGQKSNCLINLISENGSLKGFEITDEKGIKYIFLDIEYNNTGRGYYNAWFLSKIISPRGNVIDLEYKKATIQPLPSLTENVVLGSFSEDPRSGYKRKISTSSFISSLYLHKITAGDGDQVVEFESSNSDDDYGRRDLKDAYRLNGIKVKTKSAEVVGEYSTVLNFVLDYGYFESSNIGGNYLDDDDWNGPVLRSEFSYDNLSKRLKLMGMRKVSPADTTQKAEEYLFEYNEDYLLPLKTSFAIDHWGFYNGQENRSSLMNSTNDVNAEHTLIPDYMALFMYDDNYRRMEELPFFSTYRGAVRGTSGKYVNAGMLKRIVYPTGGWTNYDFEPHNYTNATTLSAEDEESVVGKRNRFTRYEVSVFPQYKPSPIDSFQITIKPTKVNVKVGIICGNDGPCSTSSNTWFNIWKTDDWSLDESKTLISSYYVSKGEAPDGNNNSWVDSIVLEPGIYYIEANITCSSNCTGYDKVVNGVIEVPIEPQLPSAPSIGGGVRIKSIENHDQSGALVQKTNYHYYGGTLIRPLSYGPPSEGIRHFKNIGEWHVGEGVLTEVLTLKLYDICNIRSDNFFNSTQTYDGTVVGYHMVEVENIDFTNTSSSGKTISNFGCKAPYIHHYRPIPSTAQVNGNLLSRLIVNDIGDTVSSMRYEYEMFDLQREAINIAVRDQNFGETYNCVYIEDRYELVFYPHVSFRNLLTSKVSSNYFKHEYNGSITNRKVDVRTDFEYNPNLNFLLHSQVTDDGSGNELRVEYDYPRDNSLEFEERLMAQRNILPVVKTERISSDGNSETKRNTYRFINEVGGPIDLDQVFYWQNDDDPNLFVDYQEYDELGNVTQYETSEGLFAIIWGYSHQYPIAVVKNLSYDYICSQYDVSNLHLLSSLDNDNCLGNGCKESDLRDALAVFRNSFPEAHITTYTYDPIIGMTSLTDPNGITIFYEHDEFGRLKCIKDHDENIIQSYEYHFHSDN